VSHQCPAILIFLWCWGSNSGPCTLPVSYIPSPYTFSFFGDTGDWTQACTLAKQVLYCLYHAPSPLRFGYFLR
jgi:hypothetical protein